MSNGLVVSKIAKKSLIINDFLAGINKQIDSSLLPIKYALDTYNYNFEYGALYEGIGVDYYKTKFNLSKYEITNIWIYKRKDYDFLTTYNILMFSTKKGNVFYGYLNKEEGNTIYELNDILFKGVPTALNYKLYSEDVIILTSPMDKMVVWDGVHDAEIIDTSPYITSMTMHYERMFATVKDEANTLYFSDDMDPTNWSAELDEGGFIELLDERGALKKVISYLNYVFIFREFGISRLIAFADQSDFSASNLFSSSGEIFSNTVCLCGNVILFLASDGMYIFNGVTTRKIMRNLQGLFGDCTNSNAIYHDGKYYLTLNLNYEDEEKIGCEKTDYLNNSLLIYDITSGKYTISRGLDIVRFANLDNQIIAVMNNGKIGFICQNGKMFDEILPRKWESGFTDFGSCNKVKIIRNININTLHDISIKVYTEKNNKTFFVKGKKSITRVNVNMRGKLIGFCITSNAPKCLVTRSSIIYSLGGNV